MKPTYSSSQAEQRSDEWFKQRKHRITASAVGAILGLSPFQTKNNIMDRMIKEYRGEDVPKLENDALTWGITNEDTALATFELETGLKVKPAYFTIHKNFEYFGASPDGVIDDRTILEIKCPFGAVRKKDKFEFKSIHDQMHYYAQMQFQMFCTDAKVCHFYQWSPYKTMHEIVKRDEEFIKDMVSKLEDFYIEYLHTREDTSINLETLMNEYVAMKAKIKELDEKCKANLEGMINLTDGFGGNIAGHKLYKSTRKGSVSYKKVVDDLLPDADLEPYRGSPSEIWSVK